MNTINICNKNNASDNLFDTLENRISYIEEILNKIKHIEFNYQKILTINEILINENEEFKKIIDKQNTKIIKLENEIIELENKNNLQNIKIDKLENENKEFKNKINILENKNLTNKIFEAIQDINSINNLENNMEYPINDYLKILRNNRNNHCHYIKINDNDDIKNIKIMKLLNYLLSLSNESKENINCLCEDNENIFIDKIIEYLQNLDLSYNVNNITKTQLKYIDIWWL